MEKRLPKAMTFFFAWDFSLGAILLALGLGGVLLTACEISPKRLPLEAKSVVLDRHRGSLTLPGANAFGDMDGDGYPDILVAELDGAVYCYQYPGWDRRTLAKRNGGKGLAVADFNGDGRLDFATNGRQVAWYENSGAGPFKEHVVLAGRPAQDLVAGDVNRDGRMDMVARDGESGLSFLLLRGEGRRWIEVGLPDAPGAAGTALADMDGDGRLDILGSGYYLRQGEDPASPGHWTRVEVAAWPASGSVGALDMDRDGCMDMVLGAADQDHRLSWFRNPGPGRTRAHWAEIPVARGLSHIRRFHAADMDGNGTMDIAFAEQPQSLHRRVGVMLNKDGRGESWTMKLFDDEGAHAIAVADVGKDGMLEVLAVNRNGNARIRLLTGLLQAPGGMAATPRLLHSARATAVAGNAP